VLNELNTLLALISMLIAVLVPSILLRKMRKYDSLAAKADALLDIQVKEDGEIVYPEALSVVGKAVGQGVSESIRMSFLGQASGDKRLDKSMFKAIANDMLDEHLPWLDMLQPVLGDAYNVRKFINKNPKGAIRLVQQFGPMIQQWLGQQGQPTRSPHSQRGSRFRS